MDIDKAKEIIKYALHKFHGNKFDKVIDNLKLEKKANNYYKEDIYLILEIKNELIEINTNFIRIRLYEYLTGNKYGSRDSEFFNKDLGYYIDYNEIDNLDFSVNGINNFKYEKVLANILAELREMQIDSILND